MCASISHDEPAHSYVHKLHGHYYVIDVAYPNAGVTRQNQSHYRDHEICTCSRVHAHDGWCLPTCQHDPPKPVSPGVILTSWALS